MVIAVPPELDGLSNAFGTGWVLLPRHRSGLGALVEWLRPGDEVQSWHVGSSIVREAQGVERIPILWATTSGIPNNEDLHKLASGLQGQGSVVGVLVRVETAGDAGWLFELIDWTRYNKAHGPFAKMVALLHGTTDALAMGLRADALDRRRLAGRGGIVNERVRGASVIIVGLGSLGSEIAHLLAQEGVRNYVLVDSDYLLPGNEARHRLGLDDAGKAKVLAMREHLLRRVPDATVVVHQKWADEILVGLRPDSGQTTILVGATGDEGTEHLLADACQSLGIPVFHAWLERSGQVLRLARSIPGRDPGLVQHRDSGEVLTFSDLDKVAGPDTCVENVLPGAALQIHASANFVVRQVMQLIAVGTEQVGVENHWLFAPGGTSGPGVPPVLRSPYGTLAISCPLRSKWG